jgi:hypothetical protein
MSQYAPKEWFMWMRLELMIQKTTPMVGVLKVNDFSFASLFSRPQQNLEMLVLAQKPHPSFSRDV